MNYGFIKPTVEKDHYVFGASPMPFIAHRDSGNWFDVRPHKEIQSIAFDTFNCTGFNTAAQIEAFMKAVFGIDVNYSDRWIGIIAGTRPPGNDPHKVCEAIREHGLIPEEMLPFSTDLETVEEYYSFKGANEAACRAEGLKWKERWEFFHEWVNLEGQSKEEAIRSIKLALTSAPLSLAVHAWAKDERGVYVKLGPENHWTFVWGQEAFTKVEDSYEPTLKDVDQMIAYCKRIYIRKRETPIKVSFWKMLIKLIKNLWK